MFGFQEVLASMRKEVHLVLHLQISLLDADAYDAATNGLVPQPHDAVVAACILLGPEVGSSCLYLCGICFLHFMLWDSLRLKACE